MVFPFQPGRILNRDEITAGHCAKIGAVLGKIHRRNIRPDAESAGIECPLHSWLLPAGQERTAVRLKQVNLLARQALEKLKRNAVMSHRDLDSKNVLWNRRGTVHHRLGGRRAGTSRTGTLGGSAELGTRRRGKAPAGPDRGPAGRLSAMEQPPSPRLGKRRPRRICRHARVAELQHRAFVESGPVPGGTGSSGLNRPQSR